MVMGESWGELLSEVSVIVKSDRVGILADEE